MKKRTYNFSEVYNGKTYTLNYQYGDYKEGNTNIGYREIITNKEKYGVSFFKGGYEIYGWETCDEDPGVSKLDSVLSQILYWEFGDEIEGRNDE